MPPSQLSADMSWSPASATRLPHLKALSQNRVAPNIFFLAAIPSLFSDSSYSLFLSCFFLSLLSFPLHCQVPSVFRPIFPSTRLYRNHTSPYRSLSVAVRFYFFHLLVFSHYFCDFHVISLANFFTRFFFPFFLSLFFFPTLFNSLFFCLFV